MTTARTDEHNGNQANRTQPWSYKPTWTHLKCRIPYGAHWFTVKAAGFMKTIRPQCTLPVSQRNRDVNKNSGSYLACSPFHISTPLPCQADVWICETA